MLYSYSFNHVSPPKICSITAITGFIIVTLNETIATISDFPINSARSQDRPGFQEYLEGKSATINEGSN